MHVLHRLLFFVGLIGFVSIASADELLTFSVVIKDGHIIPARLEVPAGKNIKHTINN